MYPTFHWLRNAVAVAPQFAGGAAAAGVPVRC